MLREIAQVFQPVSTAGVLTGVWIAVMISVPIIRWIAGEGAEHVGIAAGVVAQAAAVIAALASSLGAAAIFVVVAVPVLGWASEALGSRTGIPFGEYQYTEVLQPQIARVPVLIPFAWLMMMPPAWAIGVLVAPGMPVVQWLVAAAAFTAWDVYLDPMMVSWDFWRWKRHGAYLGIPLVNYLGWFLVAFAITALVSLVGRLVGVPFIAGLPTAPLALIYAVTWLLMVVGQFAFWRLRASAIAGFIAMGIFVVLVLVVVGP